MLNKIFLALILSLILFYIGCKEESDPLTPITDPNLFNDTVPFSKLNGGIISFERISKDGNLQGLCIINNGNSTKKSFSNQIYDGPAISPDGSKIAFSSLANSNTLYDIYLMNIDGSNWQNISNNSGQDYCPSWTPDGQNILFTNNMDVYTVNINLPSSKSIFYNFINTWPSSPLSVFDSRNIVFTDGGSVRLFNSETKQLSSIYTAQLNEVVYSPCWSPRGEEIAFILQKEGNTNNEYYPIGGIIKIYNVQTKEIKTIYDWDCQKHIDWSGSNNLSICWSPDGNKLLFNKISDGLESHIYLINKDGSGLTQITNEPGACDRSASWSK